MDNSASLFSHFLTCYNLLLMTITINGLQARYKQIGEGEPLLILHGWRGSMQSLDRLGRILSKKYRITVLELPGFGESDEPPATWTVSSYTEFVYKAMEKLNILPAHIVGHSFGGALGLSLAYRYPDACRKIFLISASIVRKPSLRTRFITIMSRLVKKIFDQPMMGMVYEFFRKVFYTIIQEKDYISVSKNMQAVMRNVLKDDLSRHVQDLRLFVHYIWGEQDQATPLWQAEYLQKNTPRSRLHIIKNFGHDLPIVGAEKVAILIMNLINNSG